MELAWLEHSVPSGEHGAIKQARVRFTIVQKLVRALGTN